MSTQKTGLPEWSPCTRARQWVNSPPPHDSPRPSIPLLLTYRLLPHKMGCKPAQSCTKAEHWPCRVSGEAGVTGDWVPSSAVLLGPVFAPVTVLLATPVRPLAWGAGARPAQAPWGSSRARADRTSTSCRTFWASSRSPKSACRLRGDGACCWGSEPFGTSKPS